MKVFALGIQELAEPTGIINLPHPVEVLVEVGCLEHHILEAAGLDGVKKKIEPGDPVDQDVYKLSKAKRKELGIKELPTTLKDALDEMEGDEVIKETLGSHVFDAFIEIKTNDWNQYCLYVSPWEIMKYLDY